MMKNGVNMNGFQKKKAMANDKLKPTEDKE
jgi:hypothetical protein